MNKSELEQHKPTHWDILKAAIQIQVTEHSPYSDHKLLQLYQEGVQQRDYDKQYQLIVALDLGCGAPYKEIISDSLQAAFQEDAERLFALMEEKTDLFQIYVYLHHCRRYILLFFTQHPGHRNALFLYECCRQLIQTASTNASADKEIQVLQSGLVELSVLDEAFWRRWLQNQEYHLQWLKLMPRVLEAVSEPALRAYADVIPIQRDIKDIHIITQAWYAISPDQRSRVIQAVSLTLCKRWEEYLKIEKGTGHFHNTLVLTAYVNVILDALVAVYSTSAACQARIIQKATALEHDLNGWFESSTQQRTCFFVNLTDLYLLLRLYPPEQFSLDSAFARAIKHTQWLLHRYNYLWKEDDMNFEKTNALLEQFSSKMKT